MSQLLLRLDMQLAESADPVLRAEIQVQRACYLARIGRFEEAAEVISTVRAAYGDGTQAKISCWLMLAEGLSEYFKRLSPRAKDRIARAQLISVAIKNPALAAITSAWKAQIDFENSDFDSMSVALRTALSFAEESDHNARSRIALVISDCLYLCGDREGAQSWFMKSRSHALEAGDQATIEALLYNRAACGMASLRAESCFGPQDRELISLIKREIASARNFQSMVGNDALLCIVALCEARILILNEEFEHALTKLRAVRGSGPFASYNYSEQLVDLDIVYCLRRLGRDREALKAFEMSPALSFDGFDVDDRLVAVWTMHELALADNRYGDASELLRALEQLRIEYRDSRDVIHKAIENALGSGVRQ